MFGPSQLNHFVLIRNLLGEVEKGWDQRLGRCSACHGIFLSLKSIRLNKSDSEKVELFANHLAEVFTPHDNTLDPEVERELATQTQHSENL